MTRIFKSYILPGIVFQSVLIGGGYASGREIWEYAASNGTSGMLSIFIAAAVFAVVFFLSVEVARMTASYEYNDWSYQFLGSGWFTFDLLFISMALVAIAVVVSAASSVLSDETGLGYLSATAFIILGIALVSGLGETFISYFKSIGTIFLYLCFIYFFYDIVTSNQFDLSYRINQSEFSSGWLGDGLTYAGYNLVVIPACLYTVKNINTRSQAAVSSLVVAFVSVLPMFLSYLVMVGHNSPLGDVDVPFLSILRSFSGESAVILYYIVLVTALIETGCGLIHALIDRIKSHIEMPIYLGDKTFGIVLALSFILASFFLSQVGIIDLVAVWYSKLAIGFAIVLVIPISVYYIKTIIRTN